MHNILKTIKEVIDKNIKIYLPHIKNSDLEDMEQRY